MNFYQAQKRRHEKLFFASYAKEFLDQFQKADIEKQKEMYQMAIDERYRLLSESWNQFGRYKELEQSRNQLLRDFYDSPITRKLKLVGIPKPWTLDELHAITQEEELLQELLDRLQMQKELIQQIQEEYQII